MTVKELHEYTTRLMQDGNEDIEVIAAIEESGQGRRILDFDLYDEPVILTVERIPSLGAARDLITGI